MAASKENIKNLNDIENLSRKEKLALYKQQKEEGDKTGKVKDNKSKIRAVKKTDALKIGIKEDKTIRQKRIQPVDLNKIREAGDERVAPGTPVALLKTRIQGAIAALNKSEETNVSKEAANINEQPSLMDFRGKLEEAVMLAQLSGIEVARNFLQELPSEIGMSSIKEHAAYWLTWVRLERENLCIENVRTLFTKAQDAVIGNAAQKAIHTAFQIFLKDHPYPTSTNHQTRYD